MQKPPTPYERVMWSAASNLATLFEQISIIRSCSEVGPAFFRLNHPHTDSFLFRAILLGRPGDRVPGLPSLQSFTDANNARPKCTDAF